MVKDWWERNNFQNVEDQIWLGDLCFMIILDVRLTKVSICLSIDKNPNKNGKIKHVPDKSKSFGETTSGEFPDFPIFSKQCSTTFGSLAAGRCWGIHSSATSQLWSYVRFPNGRGWYEKYVITQFAYTPRIFTFCWCFSADVYGIYGTA